MVFQTGDNVTWADDKPGDMKVIAAGLDWVHVQHQDENVDAYKQEQEVLKPEKLKAWSQEARDAALAARRAHMAREGGVSGRPTGIDPRTINHFVGGPKDKPASGSGPMHHALHAANASEAANKNPSPETHAAAAEAHDAAAHAFNNSIADQRRRGAGRDVTDKLTEMRDHHRAQANHHDNAANKPASTPATHAAAATTTANEASQRAHRSNSSADHEQAALAHEAAERHHTGLMTPEGRTQARHHTNLAKEHRRMQAHERAREEASKYGMGQTGLAALKPGHRITYNDGRPGHTDVHATVLHNSPTHVTVQFDDRADTTTIAHNEREWNQYLKPKK